jgi:predicted lysophospholipase L1 biosynthesis ABC-type transport system permease subunit
MIADLYLLPARGLQILAVLLGAYLLACGLNVAIERFFEWRAHRRARRVRLHFDPCGLQF